MKKEILIILSVSAVMPILIILLAVFSLGWSSLGFSVTPFGICLEWGLPAIN